MLNRHCDCRASIWILIAETNSKMVCDRAVVLLGDAEYKTALECGATMRLALVACQTLQQV